MSEGPESGEQGNVFADLGLPDPEGALVKAKLAFSLNTAIDARGWSEAEAATNLQLTEDQVASLKRGRLTEFSTDDLFQFLTQLNVDVDITLEPNASPFRSARVAVQGHVLPMAASPKSGRQEVMKFD